MDLEAAKDKLGLWAKNIGVLSLGVLVGTCYGAIIATIVTYYLS